MKERDQSPVNFDNPKDFVDAYKAACILKKEPSEPSSVDGKYICHML